MTRWWCAYEDGTVWPCEVVSVMGIFCTKVMPLAPAPDAGTEKTVLPSAVYNNDFKHPTKADVKESPRV